MSGVHILECADGAYTVGTTVDLGRRLWRHQNGEGAAYTRIRRRRPVRLAWSVELNRIDECFAVEKQVQGWGRAKRRALVEGRVELLPELASRPRRRAPG